MNSKVLDEPRVETSPDPGDQTTPAEMASKHQDPSVCIPLENLLDPKSIREITEQIVKENAADMGVKVTPQAKATMLRWLGEQYRVLLKLAALNAKQGGQTYLEEVNALYAQKKLRVSRIASQFVEWSSVIGGILLGAGLTQTFSIIEDISASITPSSTAVILAVGAAFTGTILVALKLKR